MREVLKGRLPIISVIICTYNGEKFLKQTLKSVYSQTFKDFEIIIVDDGSRDNTRAIIENEKENIYLNVYFQQNTGLAAARNFAISKSKGEWVAIIDQDDICYSDRLEKQYNLTRMNPNAELFFSNTDYINEEDEVIDDHLSKFKIPFPRIKKNTAANLLLKRGCFIDSESLFIKKELLKRINLFDNSYKYVCDYDLFIRAGFETDFIYTNEKLAAWRIHNTQATKNYKKKENEHIILYKKYLIEKNITLTTKIILLLKIIKNFYKILLSKFR